MLLKILSILSAFVICSVPAQAESQRYAEDSNLVGVFKWTADHVVNGFDSQDFLVLGFKPSYEYQRDSIKGSWSSTKQIASEIKREYTREGTVATDVRNISADHVTFHKLDTFTLEYFKRALDFTQTAKAAGMYSEAFSYVGEMFEAPAPAGSGMKAIHGVWVVTQAGAYLMIAMPGITLATATMFVGELSWNVISRTFVAVMQGLLSFVDLFQYPLELLKAPFAVLKSILFQGFSLGVTALLWSWDVLQAGILTTVQVGFATGLGVMALGTVGGIAVYQTFKAIFYDAPRFISGHRRAEYYFDPLTAIRYLTVNSCTGAKMTPEDENEMLLYRDALKAIYGKDDQAGADISKLSRTSQQMILIDNLRTFLGADQAMINGVYLQGTKDLYLFDPELGETMRIGELVIEAGKIQIKAVFKYKKSRLAKALRKLTHFRNSEEITQTIQAALARFEWTMQNSPLSLPTIAASLVNARLNEMRRGGDIDPEKELAFPYAGFSDICMFARAYRGLIEAPRGLTLAAH